ncbi:MAG: rhodanese-like domain-containing protein [Rhodobacteraceae bacterium CG17_big_fil_post_rev_8_21_14_2_50_63_15]|nr:rhodanese-like domain-containing protein [Roseovarius sp.]PIV79189.1 MAG: rhodanese-like domain-containing protein [Rhodobacteraceae bacterium CG17_big_fil_post_rev_8_21_14_2_50_63_15]
MSHPLADFATYLRGFDYDERRAMKIQMAEALELYATGQAELLDIRFADEARAWTLGFGKHIPLNELPDRLNELDPAKTIVTLCPHYDRAEIARLYLTLAGYRSRYLTDGLLGLADHLRGDRARAYVARLAEHGDE